MVMDDKSLEIVRDDLKPNDYVRKLKDNNYMIFDYEIHREINIKFIKETINTIV
jgi:hypothetical protein